MEKKRGKEYMQANEKIIDPKEFTRFAREKVKMVAIDRIKTCGSIEKQTSEA